MFAPLWSVVCQRDPTMLIMFRVLGLWWGQSMMDYSPFCQLLGEIGSKEGVAPKTFWWLLWSPADWNSYLYFLWKTPIWLQTQSSSSETLTGNDGFKEMCLLQRRGRAFTLKTDAVPFLVSSHSFTTVWRPQEGTEAVAMRFLPAGLGHFSNFSPSDQWLLSGHWPTSRP